MKHMIQHVHRALKTAAVFDVLKTRLNKVLDTCPSVVQKAVKAVTGVGGFWVLITIPELRADWLNKDLSRSFSLSIYKRHFAQLFDLVG